MSDKIRDTAEAVKGIAEAVPVYPDAIQPTAQVIGKGLETITKAALIPLMPLRLMVHGFEQMEAYLLEAMDKRLKKIPEERQIPPSPVVAGPALDALRFVVDEPDLRELYANLLATSMDSETAKTAHPAFVEMIRQMTPDEAKIMNELASSNVVAMITVGQKFNVLDNSNKVDTEDLKHFTLLPEEAGCMHTELFPSYLNNLSRLGLVEVGNDYELASTEYEELDNHPAIIGFLEAHRGDRFRLAIRHETLVLTDLGRQFCDACVAIGHLA